MIFLLNMKRFNDLFFYAQMQRIFYGILLERNQMRNEEEI